ncbi:S1 family peptidase [Streptomyces sp. NPDC059994]|uniref:S1 family peptidase n=1 Tax=Streptomyces sp. NPDC059994 TaxID=3347029 RepID=UPI0036C61F22
MLKKTSRAVVGAVVAAAGLVAAGAVPASAVHGGKTVSGTPSFAVVLENPDGSQWCGGTLIAPDKVLTAGHCLMNAAEPRSLLVVGGRSGLSSTGGQVRHIAKFKVAPDFNWNLDHDAAVITLDKPLPYKPLPLAKKTDTALYRDGRTATVYGWGMTGPGVLGTKLKQATLTLAPQDSCAPFTDPGDTRDLRVCGLPRTGTTDSICSGDSGGPLVADGKLIGIVSTGNKYCDTQYPLSVFTKVSTVAPELGL